MDFWLIQYVNQDMLVVQYFLELSSIRLNRLEIFSQITKCLYMQIHVELKLMKVNFKMSNIQSKLNLMFACLLLILISQILCKCSRVGLAVKCFLN